MPLCGCFQQAAIKRRRLDDASGHSSRLSDVAPEDVSRSREHDTLDQGETLGKVKGFILLTRCGFIRADCGGNSAGFWTDRLFKKVLIGL